MVERRAVDVIVRRTKESERPDRRREKRETEESGFGKKKLQRIAPRRKQSVSKSYFAILSVVAVHCASFKQ